MQRMLLARACGEEICGLEEVQQQRWSFLGADSGRDLAMEFMQAADFIDISTPDGNLLLCGGGGIDSENGELGASIGVFQLAGPGDEPKEESIVSLVGKDVCPHGPIVGKWMPNDAALFVLGGRKTEFSVWDTACFAAVQRTNMGSFAGRISSLDMSAVPGAPAGLVAVSESESPDVKLIDLASGASTHVLQGHSGYVRDVVWSPTNPHFLASAGRDGVRLFDVRRSGKTACLLKFDECRRMPDIDWDIDVLGRKDRSEEIRRSPSKRRRSVSGAGSQTGNLIQMQTSPLLGLGCAWESASASQKRRRKRRPEMKVWSATQSDRIYPPYQVRFSPDGMTLVAGSIEGTYHIFDIHTGLLIADHRDHSRAGGDVAFEIARDNYHLLTDRGGHLYALGLDDGGYLWERFGLAERCMSDMAIHPLYEEVYTVSGSSLHCWSSDRTTL